MPRNILAAFIFASVLTATAQQETPHASTSTTPDVPVSVTDQKLQQHDLKALKRQQNASHQQEKSAKAQRKAIRQEQKADKAAAMAQ